MDSIDLTKIAATAASDKKATRLVVQDLSGISDLCEVQFICSGANERQARAIADNIEDALKSKASTRPFGVEGKKGGHWILLDYGALVVHVFFNPVRDYYALEQIWPNARFIQISDIL